jgi:hypothetical protein
VQALTPADEVKKKRHEFWEEMQMKMGEDDFVERLISDEATFHISGKVNRHNVRIRGTQQPHAQTEHQRCPTRKYTANFSSLKHCDWRLISGHVEKLVVTTC